MSTIQKINVLRTELALAVQEYSYSLVDLWRQIPTLALEADGLSGWSDGAAYRIGVMKLRSAGMDYYDLTLDLFSGEITSWDKPASERQLYSLDLPDPSEWIEYYTNEIVKVPGSYTNMERVLENREKWAPYVKERIVPIPAPRYYYD